MGNIEKILVVDFGSQYTHLIAQKIRRLGVYSEVISPLDEAIKEIDRDVKAIILSGGPSSVYYDESPKIDLGKIVEYQIPILGICYGHQLIAYLLGGRVVEGGRGEFGRVRLKILRDHPLVKDVPKINVVWMSHRDVVVKVPDGFISIGSTDNSPTAIMVNDRSRIYGVQFHPEVDHTEYGLQILRNFLFDICGCKGDWRPMNIINEFIDEHIKYSGERALVAVSGGVDSTVTSVILKRIFNDNLHVVFINTGLLREGEEEYVKDLYAKLGFKNFHYVNAADIFLDRLKGVVDPEVKRKIIADTFIEIFEKKARELADKYGEICFLGQGTLYPDRVESGVTSRYADRIKSHHNVVITRKFGLRLLEPLKDLYKDEVRQVAKELGIPRDVYMRHPFPGPGLAVRIVGEVSGEKLSILRKADKIVEEELKRNNIYDKVWQAFPILLSVKSVGIKGDRRSYEYVIVLRIVDSENAMTASFTKLPWDIIEGIANRIVNEVEGVNRVLYDVTNKPPATIEFE